MRMDNSMEMEELLKGLEKVGVRVRFEDEPRSFIGCFFRTLLIIENSGNGKKYAALLRHRKRVGK